VTPRVGFNPKPAVGLPPQAAVGEMDKYDKNFTPEKTEKKELITLWNDSHATQH